MAYVQPSALKAKSKTAAKSDASSKDRLKADAMALAELIYDIYKEQRLKESGIIDNGQNNAKQDKQ